MSMAWTAWMAWGLSLGLHRPLESGHATLHVALGCRMQMASRKNRHFRICSQELHIVLPASWFTYFGNVTMCNSSSLCIDSYMVCHWQGHLTQCRFILHGRCCLGVGQLCLKRLCICCRLLARSPHYLASVTTTTVSGIALLGVFGNG